MLPLLLLAGVVFRPVPVEEPVQAVRIADIDADGEEDIVAVTKKNLLLLRGGRPPVLRRPLAPLTVVGRGLLGVVRNGRYHAVTDPFGEWKEGPAGPPTLLASLGKNEPALLGAPGDVDGDGKDDPVLCGPRGFHTPGGLLPLVPKAQLDIVHNEAFAVEYHIPVPVVGNWSGQPREVVFFHDGGVVAFHAGKETRRIPIPLAARGKEAAAIRRNQVFLRDIDGDGRLDLLVIVAKGKTALFAKFEATARLFLGGRIYNDEKKGFYRPASFLKVSGVLLKPSLVDLDADGDLDLVLSTLDLSILSMATGNAPGTYHLFRFDAGGYERNPAWTFRGPVPLSAFTDKPEPPVRFLPDYDGDGRPEALAVGAITRLFEADGKDGFDPGTELAVENPGRPAVGRTRAALPHAGGIVVVEAGK